MEYLAEASAVCKHCGLLIWERKRKQTFHPECKSVWDKAKLSIYKANQVIHEIRRLGYYERGTMKYSIAGMTDETILAGIKKSLPPEIVYEHKDGKFRFLSVEFRGKHPWKPRQKIRPRMRRAQIDDFEGMEREVLKNLNGTSLIHYYKPIRRADSASTSPYNSATSQLTVDTPATVVVAASMPPLTTP
jgi:hypothetical protein